MRTTALFFASALSTLIAGCVVGANDPAQNDQDIIGGTTDNGDPSVVLLRNVTAIDATAKPTSLIGCTATVIAPDVLLSAAHCFSTNALWTDVLFGTQPDIFSAATADTVYATVIQHPFYGGDYNTGHDIAVVLLSQELPLSLVQRGPTPAANATVTAVGYGNDSTAQTGFGTKREITYPVTSVDDKFINAGSEGQNVCHGDSGGPLFANGQVVGVNDWVDTADCHGGGHMTRIDTNLDFIHWYVPGF